jgi:serine protease SohB
MEYLAQYALFLAESATVLIVIAIVLVLAANAAGRGRRGFDQGRIETRRLNDVLDDMRDAVRAVVLDEKTLKKLHKDEAKAEKQRLKHEDARKRTWVLHFDGDLAASSVRALRNEVTAILTLAEEGDEVLACVESPGGMVHGYGLAASQLHRLRALQGLTLTVAVDKVAASGGYMMACIGERIIAAPFAIVGSIGVVAQVPNVHRLLKRHDIDVDVITAGEFKRTLTVFGENTEKGREKFVEEIEDVHRLFKEHVVEHRPSLDIERVATGEAWHGRQAIELGLVDELLTSDEYIVRACKERDVLEVKWTEPRSPVDRLVHQGTDALSHAVERVLLRWRERFNWTG